MVKHVERNFAGRALKLEAGRLAKQAAGSCLLQFGETVVLATVTVSDNVSTLPFFPLTVEYREKAYAAGKIPGGFLKREGRPSDDEILAARVIDRSVRPLFPEGFDRDGGGRGARADRSRDREGPRGGPQGHPRAAGRGQRARRRYAAAQDGVDQGRAAGGPGGAGEAARRGPGLRGAQPAGEVR